MSEKRTFISERERRVVFAHRPKALYDMVPEDRLQVSRGNIDTTLTYVFQKFMDALRVMGDPENAAVFKSRFKKHNDEIQKLTKSIRAVSREAVKK